MKTYSQPIDSELWVALVDDLLEDKAAIGKLIRKRAKQLAKLDATIASQDRKIQRLSVDLIARSAARLKAAAKNRNAARRDIVLRREAIVLCEVLDYLCDALDIEHDGGSINGEQ